MKLLTERHLAPHRLAPAPPSPLAVGRPARSPGAAVTAGDIGRLLLRMTVGLLLAGHGAQKLFGLFGGQGLTATGKGFDQLGYHPGTLFAGMASDDAAADYPRWSSPSSSAASAPRSSWRSSPGRHWRGRASENSGRVRSDERLELLRVVGLQELTCG